MSDGFDLSIIEGNVAAQVAPFQKNPITGEIPALDAAHDDAVTAVAAAVAAGTPADPGAGGTLQYAKVVTAPTGSGATITFDGVNNVTGVPYVGTAPSAGQQVAVLRQPPILIILGQQHM